jgi:hypothetical protein
MIKMWSFFLTVIGHGMSKTEGVSVHEQLIPIFHITFPLVGCRLRMY